MAKWPSTNNNMDEQATLQRQGDAIHEDTDASKKEV
jgi:hypothetical protein